MIAYWLNIMKLEKNQKGIKHKISQHVYLWWKIYKDKVKKYNGLVNTDFLNNGMLREGVHYSCIACISIDSVMKMEKKNIYKFV